MEIDLKQSRFSAGLGLGHQNMLGGHGKLADDPLKKGDQNFGVSGNMAFITPILYPLYSLRKIITYHCQSQWEFLLAVTSQSKAVNPNRINRLGMTGDSDFT